MSTISALAAAGKRAATRARLRYLVSRIHRLGERPLFELICEIDAGADLVPRLEAYAALDADFIRALDGNHLPGLRAIRGGR
jgi:hypothetical protein